MNNESKIYELIKSTVEEYIKANNLKPIEELLKKQLPISLLDLYVQEFNGIQLPGMTNIQHLEGYINFLNELRKIYGVELEEKKKLCK